MRIVDPATGQAVPDGVTGEIWVSGRSVAAGYYNREALTRQVFHARLPDDERRYLRTGDLGFLHDGELFITGRIKDLIIVNARNIYPQDVEAAVGRAAPAVRRAVAFSMPGEGSERLVVLAETASSRDDRPPFRDDRRGDPLQRHRGVRYRARRSPVREASHPHHDKREGAQAGGQAVVRVWRSATHQCRPSGNAGVQGMSTEFTDRFGTPASANGMYWLRASGVSDGGTADAGNDRRCGVRAVRRADGDRCGAIRGHVRHHLTGCGGGTAPVFHAPVV